MGKAQGKQRERPPRRSPPSLEAYIFPFTPFRVRCCVCFARLASRCISETWTCAMQSCSLPRRHFCASHFIIDGCRRSSCGCGCRCRCRCRVIHPSLVPACSRVPAAFGGLLRVAVRARPRRSHLDGASEQRASTRWIILVAPLGPMHADTYCFANLAKLSNLESD